MRSRTDEQPMVAATPHHVGVVVADLEAQRDWYERAFGLRAVSSHAPKPTVRTVLLASATGLGLELVEADGSSRAPRSFEDSTSAQGFHHWAVRVDDVVTAFDALVEAGAGSGRRPAAGPGGQRFAYVMDPEGNPIELVQGSA